ncbi:MAG: hypothetical protein FWE82_07970, partial [Defluviitaleaceae bacterium]|nr:hypothetical protein [Defluviitaleaceae bacterium]
MAIRQFFKRIFPVRMPYMQIVSVFFAFGLMVFAGIFFGYNLENTHLRRESEMTAESVNARLTAELRELETMLGIVSETISEMLHNGSDFSGVSEYIQLINKMVGNDAQIVGFITIFAMFDMFESPDEIIFYGLEPERDWAAMIERGEFAPEEREWYKVAAEAGGKIAATEPYADLLTGRSTFTYARSIYNARGERVAIVCVDVSLDRIHKFSESNMERHIINWFMLDKNLTVIAHYDSELIGLNLNELPGSLPDMEKALTSGNAAINEKITDHMGETRNIYFMELDNGWFLGIATLVDNYYSNLHSIQMFLLFFGMASAVGLSAVLTRIYLQKKKAEDRVRLMLDSTPLCINFWDKNMNNIDCNQTAIKFFGLADKNEYFEKYPMLFPLLQPDGKNSKDKMEEIVNITLREGFFRCEWMYRMPSGEDVPCELILVRLNYDDDFVVVVYTRDLREEKAYLAEIGKNVERLREANERALLMLESSPICVQIWDKNINTIDCNEAGVKLYGFKNKKEYIEKFMTNCMPMHQPDGSRSDETAVNLVNRAFDEGFISFTWMHKMPYDDTPMPAEITLVRA